jgi:hypothetical protein
MCEKQHMYTMMYFACTHALSAMSLCRAAAVCASLVCTVMCGTFVVCDLRHCAVAVRCSRVVTILQ